ncbi:intermembrane transport protein PqiB [Allochromatium palmeri]|uniref:MCE family protein n=1 Tax=Allochromatium palmeri TaxID=231048 RepID=A0A6N8E690_9GAMM|nr:MlaD family protein [Allochromatium palmeri]MTW19722.1 MCE family protein [Allochromatium palmeri]
MTETEREPDHRASDPIPEALVRPRGRFSLVWLIPLVALAVGAWLAFKTWSERGPIVSIEFKSASGLAAGQTRVKFRDVDIGQVTAIDFSPDLKTVIVSAELKRTFDDFLTEHTRFWVERPRVTLSGVSGLDTLVSGAYIALDPGHDGRARRHFTGLEQPPLITTFEDGGRFRLRAPTLGSLNIGSPVYYRQIQVGQVIGYALEPDGRAVGIEVFVAAPHDALITPDTRFWNASGLDVSISTAGVQVDTQSLLSVLIGGIAFGTPETIDPAQAHDPHPDAFPLYRNREAAHARIYARKERYLLLFEGAARGLTSGAPVRLKGIDVGRVLDIQLQLDTEALEFLIPVLIEVEPDRIVRSGETSVPDERQLIERLVERGLRAQLKLDSMLSGALYVDLDVDAEAPAGRLVQQGEYMVIPTRPGSLEAMTTQLASVLEKLDTVPIEQIGRDLSQTAAGANALVNAPELKGAVVELEATLAQVHAVAARLDRELGPELTKTLRESTATLERARALLSDRSPLYVEIQRTLQEVSSAARSMRLLTDYLERHPESLLQGKGRGR